jgi:hypothetical protein
VIMYEDKDVNDDWITTIERIWKMTEEDRKL